MTIHNPETGEPLVTLAEEWDQFAVLLVQKYGVPQGALKLFRLTYFIGAGGGAKRATINPRETALQLISVASQELAMHKEAKHDEHPGK